MRLVTFSDAVDRFSGDVLVVPVSIDDRPLRAGAGLIDWRMCGFLSERLKEGTFSGLYGETMLLSSSGKLECPRIFLLGTGFKRELNDSLLISLISSLLKSLQKLNVGSVGLCIPRGPVWPDSIERLGNIVKEAVAFCGSSLHREWFDTFEMHVLFPSTVHWAGRDIFEEDVVDVAVR